MKPTPILITLNEYDMKHCKGAARAVTNEMSGESDNPAYTPSKMMG